MKTSALYFHIAEKKLRTGRTKKKENNVSSWMQARLEGNMLASYLWKFSRKKLPHVHNTVSTYQIYLMLYVNNEIIPYVPQLFFIIFTYS